MQITSSGFSPWFGPNTQLPGGVSAQESQRTPKDTASAARPQTQTPPYIEAEFVDLGRSVRRPLPPVQAQPSGLFFEAEKANQTVRATPSDRTNTSMQTATQRYAQFDHEMIPAGTYLDVIA